MADYPYPAKFLAPLPAYPITVACKYVATATSKLQGLAEATCRFIFILFVLKLYDYCYPVLSVSK